MSKKFATTNDLIKFWGSQDWEVISLDESPISEITLPPTSLFVTVSGSQSMMSYCSGPSIAIAGMDIFRHDLKDYPNIINTDHYSIYSTQNKSLFEIIKDKPGYHWIKSMEEIPDPILKSLPDNTIKNIDEFIKLNFRDTVGIATSTKNKKYY